jgi:hypothetical protein
MRIVVAAIALALLPIPALRAQAVVPAPQPLVVPAFCAYGDPDPRSVQRQDDGSVTAWQGTLAWYGWFGQGGALEVRLVADAATGPCTLQFACGTSSAALDLAQPGRTVALTVPGRGYHAIRLTATAGTAPRVRQLELHGAAADGCRFSTVERRNAASVHLGYVVPKPHADDIEWFHCELTPRTDPLWSYYMATGFSRGYFGMQVNSPTERRVIFSVWDSGSEAVDRARVAKDDLVQLVTKGPLVHASGFGNEGTGGHSHVVKPWKVGETHGFLVHAKAEGTHTTYTGWYRAPAATTWELVSSFRAPKDGKLLRGLYSFNENFAGENGHVERDCEFGNVWVRTVQGEWLEVMAAGFTHDGHGRELRLDRSGGARAGRFYLRNGGFVVDDTKGVVTAYGKRIVRESGGALPESLATLPVFDASAVR